MKKQILFLGVALALMTSCDEESVGQYPIENVAPSPVTNVSVKETFGGGVTLAYTIPNDPDLMGIMAKYTLDSGKKMSVMVSGYAREITLEGFATATEHSAQLYAIDKNRNLSESTTVTFTPKRAPIFDVYETLKISNDFGGARLTWQNPEKKDIIVSVSTPITEGSDVLEDVQNFYSSGAEGVASVRGFDAEPVTFIVTISDQYGNRTDALSQECLPLYEEKIDGNTQWRRWNGDPNIPYMQYSNSYPIEKLWDGVTMAANGSGSNFFHTPGGQTFPVRFTFDMRQTFTLSRMKVYQRGSGWAYEHGNPKRFEVYGSKSPNVSMTADDPENQWIFLGYFESFKPSGLPLEQASQEDELRGPGGEEFTFPLEFATDVRYIRFDILETWGGTEMIHISELEMWGQPEGYDDENVE